MYHIEYPEITYFNHKIPSQATTELLVLLSGLKQCKDSWAQSSRSEKSSMDCETRLDIYAHVLTRFTAYFKKHPHKPIGYSKNLALKERE